MRVGLGLVCLFLVSAAAFGQGGNATITGTITDSTRAVVAGATVEAKNTANGIELYWGVEYRRELYDLGFAGRHLCRHG